MQILLDLPTLAATQRATQLMISGVQFKICRNSDPFSPMPEPDDAADADSPYPSVDDDSKWDVFLPDDDELDPLPCPGDFWIEPD
jgi:hypothetical protein